MPARFGNYYSEKLQLSDWLACMHLYNTDPVHASKWSPTFLKENLKIVAQKLHRDLGPLNAFLQCTIRKSTSVKDQRYNVFRNLIENV